MKENFEKQEKTFENQLKKVFVGVSKDKKAVANQLIHELAFVASDLTELKENIKENGTIVTAGNGAPIANPAQKQYVSILPKWSALIDQIVKLYPTDDKPINKKDTTALLDKMAGGKVKK
ncbi:hypothetical protein [Oenococcus sicerae]|uniref:P27 family phage terminase small subunit n=1 Tax=Oenococcus sicerae TaxID=2203724 RepID=A0AAJ1R897_9LACO|nr:hypothetical protein [Oenococcus sicerae]MDN6899566.1 hypothetical protein [Oenococcus sicerae]